MSLSTVPEDHLPASIAHPSMIRTKGEAGTGDVVEAVKHQRTVMADIRRAASMSDEELYAFAKELSAPYHLLKETARLKRLPVVSFAAGGVATPADAALMMQLGCDGGELNEVLVMDIG